MPKAKKPPPPAPKSPARFLFHEIEVEWTAPGASEGEVITGSFSVFSKTITAAHRERIPFKRGNPIAEAAGQLGAVSSGCRIYEVSLKDGSRQGLFFRGLNEVPRRDRLVYGSLPV